MLPKLNYIKTIYHGVDTSEFKFNPNGGANIVWAGRLIPSKGPDIVIILAKKLKYETKLFGVVKNEFKDWYKQNVNPQIYHGENTPQIYLYLNYEHHRLIKHFQTSKLFLSPISFEEPFGLVFIESMACGTPVVTFAKGATPEIIKDGKTGFLVNPSNNDIRGNWIIKKTGFVGLCEAVKKIYSMPKKEYELMRQACREHIVQNFSVETMTKKYLDVYNLLCLTQSKTKREV